MAVPKEKFESQPAQCSVGIAGYESVLSHEALAFLATLHRFAEPRRQQLLRARRERQADLDAGALPDFRADTAAIRHGDWRALYKIDGTKITVLIVKIGNRKEVYR